jgi:heme ABC exporter ATP-binding subunit CcmA
MADAVHLRNVVALAGRFPVLAGADLTVEPGQVVLLRGANGAGKTSLLRLCAGLLPVASGQALVLGEDLTLDRRGVRRRVGLLGHATQLYDDLSVRDNVRYAVRAAGAGAAAADAALERLGLTGRLPATPASRLSAGQRRRAALAVLVARRPELWLLDEPYAGLDAEARALLDAVVAGAVGGGASVIIASHEAGQVEALAQLRVEVAGGRTREPALVA